MENDNIFLMAKAAVVALMGAYGAAFGWLGGLIAVWLFCMAVDWLTGSAAAAAQGNWSSAKARTGVWHKAGMIVVVVVAAVADCVLGMVVDNIPTMDIEYTVLILPVILVWYIFTELGSIAENATDMGADVPSWLTKLLAAGKQLAENQIDVPDDENKK